MLLSVWQHDGSAERHVDWIYRNVRGARVLTPSDILLSLSTKYIVLSSFVAVVVTVASVAAVV